MSKVRLGAVAAATVLTLTSLTACGSGPSDATTVDGKPNVVVEMWAGGETDQEALDAQIDIARAANPDINIELRTAPWSDFFTKLTTTMASGEMACVTGMNSGMLAGYAAGFAELTDADLATAGLSEADLAPGSLGILTNKETLYGVPFDISTMLTYYNVDQFEAAGVEAPEPGWTFDDFEAAAKAATRDGKYGFAMGMGTFQWQSPVIAKSGVQPVTSDGILQFDNPDFVEAAEWYAGLAKDAGVAAPVASASDVGWGEEQFSAANAAMAIDGTWNAVTYLNNESGFTAGMTTLPTGDHGSLGLILGSGFGIAKNCANKEAALKVLGSLLSKDAQDYIASSGRSYPARVESQPLYFESIDPQYRDMVQEVFEAAFANVEGEFVSDNWSQIDAFFPPQLVSVYNNQGTMEDVLTTVQSQFSN